MPVKIDNKDLKKSIEEKESAILGTIISCIKNLKDLQKKFGKLKMSILNESINLNIYNNNMLNLYSNLFGIEYHQLNESVSFDQINMVKNNRNNYYSYLKNVSDFLNGYELGIQNSLNESFEPVILSNDNNKSKALINLGTKITKTFGIESFKDDLKKVIDKLESIDEVETYSKDIINIKIFANKPIFVYGFDIVNNFGLQKELREKFNVNQNSLMSIIYDKSNKELLFVYQNDIIHYSLENDKFEIKEKSININKSTYLDFVKNEINANIIELYKNIGMLELKFTDNLYHDIERKKFMEDIKKQILK